MPKKGNTMPVSEDGVPYGSIDVNELDSVDPKTDEAKAAVEALKARRDEGNEAADKAAEDSLKAAEAQANPQSETKTTEAPPPFDQKSGEQKSGEQKADADKQQAAKKSASSDKG